MSYILDALERAEAERQRGHGPDRHSPAGLRAGTPPPAGPQERRTDWRWLAGSAVVLACVAAGAWWLNRPTVAAPAVPTLTTPDAASTVAAAPAPPSNVAPATAHTTPAAAPPEAASARPILAPPEPPRASTASARPAAPPAPAVPAGSATAASPKPPVTAASSRTERPAAAVATAPASAATSTAPPSGATSAQATATPALPAAPDRTAAAANAPTPVRLWAELPAETRAQLPTVSVSGSTFSQNPAHRMLIANGQVVQEGQSVAPGLVLESIGPRSAVLNHQGLRYSIAY